MKKLSVAVLLVVVAACGNSGGHGPSFSHQRVEVDRFQHRSTVEGNRGNEFQIETEKKEEVQDDDIKIDLQTEKKLEGSKRDVDNRPFGVGALSVLTGKSESSADSKKLIVSYDVCTATYLENGEVITAAHCISKKIRDQIGKDGACSTVSFLHADESQTFRCQKILWSPSALGSFEFSEKITDEGVYADVLIFKTDGIPAHIKPMKLSKSFVDTEENYKAWVYAPPPPPTNNASAESLTALPAIMQKGLSFIFKEHSSCPITDASAEGYPYRIFGCSVVHGNSGAPFINSKNEVQGIIDGIIDGFIDGGKSGYVTDLGCLEKTSDGLYQWKKSCPSHGFLQKGI